MTSVVLYNQINPLTALFSRTHFPFPMSKDFPAEICCSVKHKLQSRKQETGHFKEVTRRVRSSVAGGLQPELSESGSASRPPEKKLRVLVAGGGIGGLVFALAAKRKGFEVVVFEKDLSAIRGEGQYRGPIQIQSNALAALEAIDMDVADEVMCSGCITGDRINGLVDGISGSWYVKFDTFTPAVEWGLPVTRVISRMTLQEILARAVGSDTIMNESNVVDFVDNGEKVTVKLENGQCYEGDVLVGADGIWSKVTLVILELHFVPADIDTVGYRVFLGHKQYFVSSDVGGGKMQWYAFHNESPGGTDVPKGRKERLLKLFEGWCDNVIDLLLATDEDAILRRDIYDRTPIFTWGKGHVTLLGDSAHAMQPNLGQGVVWPLRYENARKIRVAIIHGLARMAAMMASTYKAYLGVGLGPLSNNALERALDADWFLLPVGGSTSASEIFFLSRDEKKPCIIGSVPHANTPGVSITIPSQQAAFRVKAMKIQHKRTPNEDETESLQAM
ncbi:Zeaxanthin epoxidase, chloroplastic [Sesamum angolense]|uniref:Zeaxanthin epoxidase, chloroplastic n=1 Tax=Sesamum angolense TaxID=2727404 RepID=A0AAE2C5E2_9LAMI|nr:Zeaxanthin epoxidase, chloroplastic [Sesamum angolense]